MHHTLFHRSFICIVTFFVVATLYVSFAVPAHAAAQTLATPYDDTRIVQAINRIRTTRSLVQLKTNTALAVAAQKKANDMAARNYFSHNTPEGIRYSKFITRAGYSFSSAGENLAVSFKTTGDLMRSWLTSKDHRANILNRTYTDVGVGIAFGKRNGHMGWYVVTLFGAPTPKLVHASLYSAP